MGIKEITGKQRVELEELLSEVKKRHPRKYKYLGLHLNDMGNRIKLGMVEPKGGAFWGVTAFMGYEAMWFILQSLCVSVDDEIDRNMETWKACKII